MLHATCYNATHMLHVAWIILIMRRFDKETSASSAKGGRDGDGLWIPSLLSLHGIPTPTTPPTVPLSPVSSLSLSLSTTRVTDRYPPSSIYPMSSHNLPPSGHMNQQASSRLRQTKSSTLRGISTRKMRMKALSGANAESTMTSSAISSHKTKQVKGDAVLVRAQSQALVSRRVKVEEQVDDYPCMKPEEVEAKALHVISSSIEKTVDDVCKVGATATQTYSMQIEDNYTAKKMPKAPPQLDSLLKAACIKGPKGINACGAIKVLTEREGNRVSLAHTYGVVLTLTKVLESESSKFVNSSNGVKIASNKDLDTSRAELELSLRLYGEASERSMQALHNLSLANENRDLLFHSSGFVACIMSVLQNDNGRLRMLASHILLNLAKCHDVKLLLAGKVKGLLSLITKIIVSGDEYNNDERRKYFYEARTSLLQTLLELTKTPHCCFLVARQRGFLSEWIKITNQQNNSIRVDCMNIIANLSRLGDNGFLIILTPGFFPTIMKASRSSNIQYKKYSLYTLLNLSSEFSCQVLLAKEKGILRNLCDCAEDPNNTGEIRLIATRILKNLSHHPRNIIYFANEQCFESIVRLLKDSDDTSGNIQYLAADIIGMLSRYLSATSILGEMKNESEVTVTSDKLPRINVLLDKGKLQSTFPTHKVRGYRRFS